MATNNNATGGDRAGLNRRTVENVSQAAEPVRKVVYVAGVVKDAYRISKAVYTDCKKRKKKRPGKRTIKAVSSVAAGRTAGAVGSYVGAAIGGVFGGIGAVPGAAIGGLAASFGASILTEEIVDRTVSSDSEDENY
jgi:outer membrane lipoprotein SlyB